MASLKKKVHKIEIFHLKIFLNNIKSTFEVIKYFFISIFFLDENIYICI